MLEFTARFEGADQIAKLVDRLGVEGGPVQLALDNSVVRYLHDYWAMDTGLLADSVRGIGTGELVYFQPYAHYQYYGVLYTDEAGRTWVGAGETKPVNTGIPLVYKTDVNPLAGAFPLERMKADHMKDIVEEVQNFVLGEL